MSGSPAAVAELRVEYTNSLERLDEAGWDGLAGSGDLYATTAWLRFVEDAMQGAPTYLLGWDRDRLASGLACYWFPPDATFAPMARVDRMLRRAHLAPGLSRGERRRRGRAFAALLPTLCCGSRQLSYSRLLLAPGLDAHRARAATGEMLAAAELLARRLGAASLSFNWVDAHDEPLRGELRARGFAEFFSQRRCVLEVDDLDGYLSRFRSHRRVVIRRELRALDEAGVRCELVRLAELPVEQVAPLEHNLLRRYGVRRFGSTALHLCYVALGGLDFVHDDRATLRDVAGAASVLLEAGGLLTSETGASLFPLIAGQSASTPISLLAGHPHAHADALRDLLAARTAAVMAGGVV